MSKKTNIFIPLDFICSPCSWNQIQDRNAKIFSNAKKHGSFKAMRKSIIHENKELYCP